LVLRKAWGVLKGGRVCYPSFTYEISLLISSRLEDKISSQGWTTMADDVLKPEKSGNSRAAQTRIKGKSAGGIGGQRAHDLRIGPQPDYVDASRAHLNRVLIEPQTGTQLRKICEERRALRTTTRAMKSSAAVGVIGIITFGHEAQKIFKALTPEQQDAAYHETAEAIATRLNTTLTGLVTHGDESAPHAHFQLPAYNLTGRPVSETAKRAALRDLQTITAEVMARHAPGIERGRSKTDRLKAGATPAEVVNRAVAQLHDELPIEAAQLDAKIAAKRKQSAALDGEIAARQGLLSELAAKIEKNERLAAAALEKAATNEAKADKALKNAALYEGRAEKARRERDAEERTLSNLQLDRRKEEERLERLQEQLAVIETEKQKLAEREAQISLKAAELEKREATVAATEKQQAATEKVLERSIKNFGVMLGEVQKTGGDQPLLREDMADAPEEFTILEKASARDARPLTRGFRSRFWSLNYSNTGTPVPLAESLRAVITKAFDFADRFAQEIAKTRQAAKEAEKRRIEADRAFTQAKEAGRVEGLRIGTAALAERETVVAKRESRADEWATETLSWREQFFERGFTILTAAIRKHLKPDVIEEVTAAYKTELGNLAPKEPTPRNLSSTYDPGHSP